MSTLSDQLHASADRLSPQDGLLARVRVGGRSRLRRRHAVRVAGAAGLATAVVGTGLAVLPRSGGADTLGPATSGPPQVSQVGRSAAEEAFGRDALAIWNGHPTASDADDRGFFDDVRGAAQVQWAGDTPGGLAAVVAQRTYLHEHNNLNADNAGLYTLYGFFGHDAAGKPALVGTDYVRESGRVDNRVGGWWVDPGRTVLAVLTEDRPLAVSRTWTYTADGHARRADWRAVTELGVGVGFIRTTPSESLVLATQPFRTYQDVRQVVGGPAPESSPEAPSGVFMPVDRRLIDGRPPRTSWNGQVVEIGPHAGTRGGYGATSQAFTSALEAATEPASRMVGHSIWFLRGAGFVVGERALDSDPSRLYALIGERLVDGGAIDATAPLPVAMRLPDARGWVVGSPGATLRWRHAGGAWTAIPDAALLPDGAGLQVEVTRDGGAPVVVAP